MRASPAAEASISIPSAATGKRRRLPMSALLGSEMLAADGVTALRGAVLTYRDDPFLTDAATAVCYEADAIVAMAAGKIVAFGPAAALRPMLPAGLTPIHYPD